MGITPWETIETDVLVLGSGRVGLCAALHMADSAAPQSPGTPSPPSGEGAGG